MAAVRFVFLVVLIHISLVFPARANDAVSILLFGDSIIAGYGLKKPDSIPVRLDAMLRERNSAVRVINGGVSGDTTSGGRKRLTAVLDKHQPDLVVLALGGNDMLRGVDPRTTYENLDAMLGLLRERQIPTILSAVKAPINRGMEYRNAFNGIYPNLAQKYDVPLYPFLLEKVYGKREYMQRDGIHPNTHGAALIAYDLGIYLMEEMDVAR